MNKAVNTNRALVIDGNESARRAHQIYLEMLRCRVFHVPDGEKALKYLDIDLDIIFMELGLTDLHGADIANCFRNSKLHLDTPIIAITSVDIIGVTTLKKFGINEVMVKPIFKKEFEVILKKYLF